MKTSFSLSKLTPESIEKIAEYQHKEKKVEKY